MKYLLLLFIFVGCTEPKQVIIKIENYDSTRCKYYLKTADKIGYKIDTCGKYKLYEQL